MTSVNLRPGARIGPYVLGRCLGVGLRGVVYTARHALLGSEHAIKVLDLGDGHLVDRLQSEAQLRSRIRHDNVVAVTDVLMWAGGPALVMQLVEGPTLDHWLDEQEDGVPPETIDLLARDLMAGMAAAHAHGVVLRDLQPRHILVEDWRGRPFARIGEMSLAAALSHSSSEGATRVLTRYAAPEQRQGTADARSDLYALGMILRGLLARATPGVPERWRSAVLSCLEPDVEDRAPDVATARAEWCGPEDPAAAGPPWEEHPSIEQLVDGGAAVSAHLRGCAACRVELRLYRDTFGSTPAAGHPSAFSEDLVGRRALIHQIEAALRPGHVVTLTGLGGIGKTCIAREVRRRAEAGGGLAPIWCDLEGETDAAALQARLSAAITGEPDGADLVGALSSAGDRLLILDGAEPTAGTIGAIGACLDIGPALRLLVTARAPLGGRRERVVVIGPLSLDDARRLLAAQVHARDPSRPDAIPDAVLERLEGHPESLRLAARRLQLLSPAQLAARLDRRFELLRDRAGGLDAVMRQTWAGLDPSERSALGALCGEADEGPPSLGVTRRLREQGLLDGETETPPEWVREWVCDVNARSITRAGGASGIRH